MLTVCALIVPAASGQASTTSTGSWWAQEGTLRPTQYWTNEIETGNDMAAGTSVPYGATVTDVSFSYSMLDPVPAGTDLYVYLCWGLNQGTNYCTEVSPAFNAQSWSGTTSDFAGLDADQPFRFATYLASPTTQSLAPNYYYSQSFSLTVNYSY
jgi:hypothetical protein